jgi:hypothetical protein
VLLQVIRQQALLITNTMGTCLLVLICANNKCSKVLLKIPVVGAVRLSNKAATK